MKTIICRFVLATIVSLFMLLKSYSQVPDRKANSYTELQQILSGKSENTTTIMWTRIGHKISRRFVRKFHRDPDEAVWTMIDDLIYASFLYKNKETIAVYNKHGRLVRVVTKT